MSPSGTLNSSSPGPPIQKYPSPCLYIWISRSSRTRALTISECILSRSSGESSAAGDERTGRRLVLTSGLLRAALRLAQRALERHVRPGRKDVHWTAVAVERRIEERLVVHAEGDLLVEGRPVEHLGQDFRPVTKRAVADEKSVAPGGRRDAPPRAPRRPPLHPPRRAPFSTGHLRGRRRRPATDRSR